MASSDGSYPIQGILATITDLSIPGQTSGDLTYYDGSHWNRLAKGTGLLHGGTTPSYSLIVDADISGTAAIAKSKISASGAWVLADLPTGTGYLHSSGGTNVYQAITSGDVTTGLGYTPLKNVTDTLTGTLTLNGGLAGTYNIGGTPKLTSTLLMNGQTLSGNFSYDATITFINSSPFTLQNSQILTFSVTAQTVSAATLTIPNFAGVSDTFAFLTLPQTFVGTKTFSGGITMSSADITLAGNKIKTTSFNLYETTVGGDTSLFLQATTPNSLTELSIAPTGTNTTGGGIQLHRKSDYSTNIEALFIRADLIAVGEFYIGSRINGSGTLRPINIYMGNTKLMSFDTAFTITSYVNQIFQGIISTYNNIATAGMGVPVIYGSGRKTAQTGASGTVVTYTVGASDGLFEVSADVLATTSTTYSFMVMVDWTDEAGTARTTGLLFSGMGVSGSSATLSNATGPDFQGLPMTIRAKAGTAITIHTNTGGTYTAVTYNIDGIIKQIA